MKKTIIFLIILGSFTYCFYWLLFCKSISNPKYSNIKSLSKIFFGATVYNMTSKPIHVTDYKSIKILPPKKNSKQIGLFDVDSLIIKETMKYKNKTYSLKVFRFCDYATIKIIENGNNTEIVASPMSNICKIIDDFGFYDTIDEAFK